ncbi:single-stranded DNA-binding protein [Patescibacteria group bacterium]|nr:single-stranded DNA-binding protein [Patescibacteria group bacterium]MBU1890746.1 single-stranded DNA-binding protein [Patescibacteria group bacterium]
MNLNKASIIGNLTRDPESRKLPSGQTITTLGVATNHVWRDAKSQEKKKSVEFHNVVAWGKLGEICAQYLRKASKVYVEGRLQTRTWEDKSGAKKNRTEIVADDLIMLGHLSAKKDEQNEAKKEEELAKEEVSMEEVPVE